jgi:hypothetical protein
MEEVAQNLYVGDDDDCQRAPDDWAVVHACKHDCHQKGVGYTGDLNQSHPEYLIAQRESDLYLNIVDMERKLSHEYTEPIVSATFDFIDDNRDSKEVLVHCNQGRSRSPALAMLYLAKRADTLPDSDYESAKQAFADLYPPYRPGRGIELYLREYWPQLA